MEDTKLKDTSHPNFNLPPRRKYKHHNWTKDLCLATPSIDEARKARNDFFSDHRSSKKSSLKRSYSE